MATTITNDPLAMERESEQMQAIRNLATYARPASGGDRSRFAYIHRETISDYLYSGVPIIDDRNVGVITEVDYGPRF